MKMSIAVTGALCAAAVTTAAFAAKPTTRNRVEIPAEFRWDFSAIYPDWAAWEADMKEMDARMDAFAKLQGTLAQGPDALLKAYQSFDEIGKLQYRLYRYPQLQRDVDTRDQAVAGRFQRVTALFAKFDTASAWFTPELLKIPEATTKEWIAKTPALAPYRFPIVDAYRRQAHVLDDKGERLLSFATQFNQAPRTIYQELSTSDIKYPTLRLGDGSSLPAATLTLAAGKLSADLGDGKPRPFDLSRVAAIEQVNGPASWLTDRQPAENVYLPYFGTGQDFPARMNLSGDGGRDLRFGGKSFRRGIAVHAYSRLVYPLDGQFAALRLQYAVDERMARADMTVRVKLDDKVVHEKQAVRGGTLSPVIFADLGGAKRLTLEVDYGGGTDVQDRLVWLEPALLRHKPAAEPPATPPPAATPATPPQPAGAQPSQPAATPPATTPSPSPASNPAKAAGDVGR